MTKKELGGGTGIYRNPLQGDEIYDAREEKNPEERLRREGGSLPGGGLAL